MTTRRCVLVALLALALFISTTPTRNASSAEDLDRQAIVDDVLAVFDEQYVDSEVAERMGSSVRRRLADGSYGGITDLDRFAARLTADLREVSGDGHIAVYRIRGESFFKADNQALTPADVERHARVNFGFVAAERLAGNVGYLRLDHFDYPEIAGPTATAAVGFLASCDAVIVDLRTNIGGREGMVQYLLSYLFEERTHFLDVFGRDGRIVEQSWSLPYVPGPRLVDTPVWVLTSAGTGSAAEAFAYHLKSFGRATVVGETTMGIAHWIDVVDLQDHSLRVHVPNARPINPVTGGNWEGVGVAPDIETPAADALGAAHVAAIARLIEASTNDDDRRQLEWELVEAEAGAVPIEWGEEAMARYTGEYSDGRHVILVVDGRLVWRTANGDEWGGIAPLTADVLGFDDTDDCRIRFSRDERGAVSGFQVIYKDGTAGSVHPRTGDPGSP